MITRLLPALFIASLACAAQQPQRGTHAAVDTVPPSLRGMKLPLVTWPPPLLSAGVEGRVDLTLAVTARGTIDTSRTIIDHASLPAFRTRLVSQIALWKIRPARANGRAVAATLPLHVLYRIDDRCNWPGPARQRVDLDSTPVTITSTECKRLLGGPPVDPKYIRTVKTTIAGVWSPGFEDGFFTPCRDVKIPIKAPGFTGRRMVAHSKPAYADTLWARFEALGSPPAQDKRYYVKWEGLLTGPKASGHFGGASFEFIPTKVLVAAWWSEHPCPLE